MPIPDDNGIIHALGTHKLRQELREHQEKNWTWYFFLILNQIL